MAIRQAALVGDKSALEGIEACLRRCAIQIDDLHLFTFNITDSFCASVQSVQHGVGGQHLPADDGVSGARKNIDSVADESLQSSVTASLASFVQSQPSVAKESLSFSAIEPASYAASALNHKQSSLYLANEAALSTAPAANHLSSQYYTANEPTSSTVFSTNHASAQYHPANELPRSTSSSANVAASAELSTNPASAQYSQFLASVRDFTPLVAELNTSIASIASSVNTMQAGVLRGEVMSIIWSICHEFPK